MTHSGQRSKEVFGDEQFNRWLQITIVQSWCILLVAKKIMSQQVTFNNQGITACVSHTASHNHYYKNLKGFDKLQSNPKHNKIEKHGRQSFWPLITISPYNAWSYQLFPIWHVNGYIIGYITKLYICTSI